MTQSHYQSPLRSPAPDAAALTDAELQQLFALRDAELPDAEAAQLREKMDTNPAMQEAARQLGGLERRTADIFSPARLATQSAAAPAPRYSRVLVLALAAALLLATALITLNMPRAMPGPDASSLHAALVQSDRPDVVCDTPEKFLAYTTEKLGEAITARFDTGIALIGWRGAAEYREDSRKRVLIARAATGEPVLVLFQPTTDAPPTQTNPSLHMHKLMLGTVTAWEVSPLPEAVVLSTLSRANR